MGNKSNKEDQFQRNDWDLLQKTDSLSVWQNRSDRNLQLEEVPVFLSSEE